MGDFALIEENVFQTLVNAYATLEILRQQNPDFEADLNFDEEAYEMVKQAFQDDYVQVPIDLSEQALEKLKEKFGGD